MSPKIASLLTAIALIGVSTAPASAEPSSRTASERVSYADLDISSDVGVTTLKIRLNRALDRVCGDPSESVSMAIRRAVRACRKDAMDQALASIGVPAITTAYLADRRSAISSR